MCCLEENLMNWFESCNECLFFVGFNKNDLKKNIKRENGEEVVVRCYVGYGIVWEKELIFKIVVEGGCFLWSS